ncbi:phosphotransferase family protein [Streptomyces tagetis]|uniref:Aminoglycoside phosphotransferase family protein n=1 Tax=Streptomyces tagetis TaxID=2820809 RepID=A0A940XS05_9ACTN|nr:aminoglycoside phosphotransferase family protein [Streptomyces sp. RG38]MBQ0830105.1 aminoglycoside phosphotransferase family protein [Streptomyces sp. RG38]
MTPVTTIGGFAQGRWEDVLRRACAVAGLEAAGARVLRGHTNAVVLLERESVVVKIARHGSRPADAVRTVRFVRWLMEQGFPTVPLHPVAAEQPVVVDGHAVTFWTYLPQPDHPVRAEQLAPLLHALHRLGPPPVELPARDTVAAIASSLGGITDVPARLVDVLSVRLRALAEELAEVRFPYPETVVQGDPQHRNALHHGGEAVLCDWDTVARGHREWDLVTVEIHCRRFGYGDAHYRDFASSYGRDITSWEGYSTLRDLRELRMITTNARKIGHAPGSRAEVIRRIEGLIEGDTTLRWHIL